LHAASLGDDKDMGNKILKQSVTKKANTNKNITPLHCSCINPDPYFLKTLLDANPDFEVLDDDMRRPVHYAAACESPEPLKHLI